MPRAFNSLFPRNKFAKRRYEAIVLAMQDARFHLRASALDQWQCIVNCLLTISLSIMDSSSASGSSVRVSPGRTCGRTIAVSSLS